MTWHFFEFRMKDLSANGEECACKLGRGGGSRQHVQTCGGHAQSITTSALPTQVDPMYKCIIELPSLAMNK